MGQVTVRALDAAKPQETEYKLRVDRGLYLRVAPDGGKTWLVRYCVNRRQTQRRLPKPYGCTEGCLSLAAARSENARIQSLARSGVDPLEDAEERLRIAQADQERRRIESLTFGDMFDAWITDGVRRGDCNAELRRAFQKDVLPALGAKNVRALTEQDLRSVLRAMIARGVNRMAIRVFRDLRQLFSWAERRRPWRGLLVEGNPAELVEMSTLLSSDFDMSEERDRVLSDGEIAELRDVFRSMEEGFAGAADKRRAARPLQAETQLALWICLSTLCRIGELLKAEWSHVALDKGEWFIPKSNVKGARGRKQDHLVFLSPFAVAQFGALRAISGHSTWCFPARATKGALPASVERTDVSSHLDLKTVSKQVGDRQSMFKQRKALARRRHDNSLVLSGGKNGEWTPHDLRRTGATLMQALGVVPDVIDRCQNHVLKGSRVRRHYLHHDYRKETAEAWRRLGEHLELVLCDRVDAFAEPAKVERSPTFNVNAVARRTTTAAPSLPATSPTRRAAG